MKQSLAGVMCLLSVMVGGLTGCHAVGDKSASMTVIYAATAVLALVMLIGYCCLVRKKSGWFLLMFSSVLVVNIGYFCLVTSTSLGEALLANRIAYLGSVMLPAAMLMIILQVTDTPYPKWVPWSLLGLSAVVLVIAASPGYLDIYYKDVSFEIVNGVATLVKVYGPLHPLYLFYLLGYFAAMIAVIVRAQVKKTIDTTAHAVVVAIAVFVNLGVWFIEQLVAIDFEILSVSYIISELFLLGAHLMITENQRLKDKLREQSILTSSTESDAKPASDDDVFAEAKALFLRGYDTLTPREKELFDAYVAGESTKEIMTALGIKENTLKYHSRNLYGKLGVSSRKQLVALYQRIRSSEQQP